MYSLKSICFHPHTANVYQPYAIPVFLFFFNFIFDNSSQFNVLRHRTRNGKIRVWLVSEPLKIRLTMYENKNRRNACIKSRVCSTSSLPPSLPVCIINPVLFITYFFTSRYWASSLQAVRGGEKGKKRRWSFAKLNHAGEGSVLYGALSLTTTNTKWPCHNSSETVCRQQAETWPRSSIGQGGHWMFKELGVPLGEIVGGLSAEVSFHFVLATYKW